MSDAAVAPVASGPDRALAHLVDPQLPVLPTLLTDPAPLVGAALAPLGGVVHRIEPRQPTWRPGRSLTVRYDARVGWPSGATTDEIIVAATGRIPTGAFMLDSGDMQVGLWRLPHDPELPGLAPVTDPAALDQLLDGLDVPGGAVSHRLVAYRPGRRAVVRVHRAGTTVFVKVVRPDRAEALHRRHVALASALRVPHSLGIDPRLGLVVLQGLGGTLLRHRLQRPSGGLPSPEALLRMLDRLPEPPDDARAARGRAREWTTLLRRVRPEQALKLDALADALEAADGMTDEPLVPVHGDLHDAQLLVHGDDVAGVLDLDTYALGRRTDDLANLIGHLSTLALGSPHRASFAAYAERLLAGFDRVVDPITLRYSVAQTVLGLASGPFRVLEPQWPANTDARIDLAHRWAASARRYRRGRPLRHGRRT